MKSKILLMLVILPNLINGQKVNSTAIESIPHRSCQVENFKWLIDEFCNSKVDSIYEGIEIEIDYDGTITKISNNKEPGDEFEECVSTFIATEGFNFGRIDTSFFQKGISYRQNYVFHVYDKEHRDEAKIPWQFMEPLRLPPKGLEKLIAEMNPCTELNPVFMGCENIFEKDSIRNCSQTEYHKYIYSNLKYPNQSKNGQIEGRVVIIGRMDEVGDFYDLQVVRSLNKECDEEAIRLIDEMPHFQREFGKCKIIHEVKMSFPIKFEIIDE